MAAVHLYLLKFPGSRKGQFDVKPKNAITGGHLSHGLFKNTTIATPNHPLDPCLPNASPTAEPTAPWRLCTQAAPHPT